MAILKDIIEFIKDFKEHLDSEKLDISSMKRNSIGKMSTNAILQFPVIASKTLSIPDITMVSKALEREYCTFIRIAMSMHSNEDKFRNPEDYIKQFHTNSEEFYPIKDLVINTASNVIGESTLDIKIPEYEKNNYRKIYENMLSILESTSAIFLNPELKKVVEEYDSLEEEMDEVILENKIDVVKFNDIYKYPQILKEVATFVTSNKDNGKSLYSFKNNLFFVKETHLSKQISSLKILKEGNTIKVFQTPTLFLMEGMDYSGFMGKIESGNKELLKEFADFNYDNLNNKFKFNNHTLCPKNLSEAKRGVTVQNTINNPPSPVNIRGGDIVGGDINITNKMPAAPTQMNFKDQLLDNDVKKANELIPTIIAVRVNFVKDNINVPTDFILGIKTIVHPVGSEEVIENLSKGLKEKNVFFNFIRWTTGEIQFMKDFILNLDNIKGDVINKFSKGASFWWSALKRRKTLAKAKAMLMMKNQILPNATIVVSIEEANYLKSEYGVDLMNVKTVRGLMDHYFLLGFVILDPSSELGYFLFDGYSSYQTYGYTSLERENSNTAKEVKNLMQALGKM